MRIPMYGSIGYYRGKRYRITKNSDNFLTVNAALLAQKGRVGRVYYGNSKNTITVYGAIATNTRYGFAYTDVQATTLAICIMITIFCIFRRHIFRQGRSI